MKVLIIVVLILFVLVFLQLFFIAVYDFGIKCRHYNVEDLFVEGKIVTPLIMLSTTCGHIAILLALIFWVLSS